MLDNIKKLREITSLGVNDCKKALEEAHGDFNKALEILKKRGAEVMEKKKSRVTLQGRIESYVHFSGNLGSLVELNCETDFVSNTEVFKKFAKDLAMHIAAASPKYITRQDIPKEIQGNITEIDEYAKKNCLLEQPFIKDDTITVGQYLQNVIAQTGENIVIKRFSRFCLGEYENEI
ncbi:MAG: elongation factor Ts [Candidatus Omnitrophica bacterium]|nr:elongation factor Ts [Candidatus Omnitrophota bacterium]